MISTSAHDVECPLRNFVRLKNSLGGAATFSQHAFEVKLSFTFGAKRNKE
ncbi:MAG: hypothetical protein ACKOKA_02805 [Acidimicrobiaceae bacterium]